MYDRSNLNDASSDGGELGELVQVGWGLNLAMVASISLAIAGAVWVVRVSEEERSQALQQVGPLEPIEPAYRTVPIRTEIPSSSVYSECAALSGVFESKDIDEGEES